MAITITKDYPHAKKIGKGVWLLCGVFALDSSYPTGGEDASPISKYFKDIKRIVFDSISKYFKDIKRIVFDSKDGYNFEYDNTNDKILAHVGGFEVANETDLSGVTGVSFIAIGYV